MKKNNWIRLAALFGIVAALTFIQSCGDDDEAPELVLSSLTANGIDLNGATTPNNVATNAVITATFSTELNESTVNGNISLLRDYDDATVQVTVALAADKRTVTITPTAPFGTGYSFCVID